MTMEELMARKNLANRTAMNVGVTILSFTPAGRATRLGEVAVGGLKGYLIEKTIEASVDVFAQLVVNNFDVRKVDWFDVAINYVPMGDLNKFVKVALKNAASAAVDVTLDEVKVAGKNKSAATAATEALVGSICDAIYGELNIKLVEQLIGKGYETKQITAIVSNIKKEQKDVIANIVKNTVVKAAEPKEDAKKGSD